jgi:hypothetical protein
MPLRPGTTSSVWAPLTSNDRGRELGAVIRRLAKKDRLVEPEGLDHSEAVWLLKQGLAVREDGVIHAVPVTAEFPWPPRTHCARAAPPAR